MRVAFGNCGPRDKNRGLEVALWESAVMEISGGRWVAKLGESDDAYVDRLNKGKLSATNELRTSIDGNIVAFDWFDKGRTATTYACAPGTGSHSISAQANTAEAAAAAQEVNSACCTSEPTFRVP